MMKVISWLKGKKSYVIGACVVVYGIYQHFFADMPWPMVVDYVFGGAGFMAIRAALAKIGLADK